ncbi:SDR family oxidoreductase [Rhodococcus sp. HM1]|uniref:SDR family NAD(P)-dependent oxidoreductase n=1 Tax=Rhodococcus sp. HM1 TaxID=2937759 RepID=UPI00200A0DBA|nr:SDR family oxidoreductase [Rhodococcus sp. HM1]MCK8671558.1 SDR family oxidoreductase [Rhodococcus sp. HM1]
MSRFEEGASALVTGAAGGIGRAIARRLAAENVSMTLTDVDPEGLLDVAREVTHLGGKVVAEVGDITDAAFRARLVERSIQEFGRLDALINNAGIMVSGTPDSITEEAWDRIYGINARAPFFLVQEALPHLIATKGAIVNQSSVLGLVGMVSGASYVSSKAAVVGLTWALAADLAPHGVRVNAVCPGTIDTPMPWTYAEAALGPGHEKEAEEVFVARQLIKRMGTPDEVAAVVVFLASSDASFMTGAAVPVDGGWSAS